MNRLKEILLDNFYLDRINYKFLYSNFFMIFIFFQMTVISKFGKNEGLAVTEGLFNDQAKLIV